MDALKDPGWNFNIDESGFSLSSKQRKVLILMEEKIVFEEASISQITNIILVATVCADGRVPPPMIIYPRKRISPTMAEKFPEGYDFMVGESEKGYITCMSL